MEKKSVSNNKIFNVRGLILGLAVAGISLHQDATAGQAPVDLGWAGSFAILSKSGITDVPTSAITGNVGTSPITGAAITGIGLTVGNGAVVTLSGGAQAKNIFWQVAGQTTLGTTADFKGIILCATAIVLNTGATLVGRAPGQTAVTLQMNPVTEPDPSDSGFYFTPANLNSHRLCLL